MHDIRLVDKKAELISDGLCLKCGHCVSVCPKEAVTLTGFKEDPVPTTGVRLDPDDLLTAIRERRSIRQFKDQKVEPEKIRKILRAGMYTPTATNKQMVSCTILDKHRDEAEEKVSRFFGTLIKAGKIVVPGLRDFEMGDHWFFHEAPLVIIVNASTSLDAGLAASNMELMAESLGLGVLYNEMFILGARRLPSVMRLLGVPKGQKPVIALVIGYPKVHYLRTAQKERPQVIHR